MKKFLLIVPTFLVFGFVAATVSVPMLANAQTEEVASAEEAERQTMIAAIATQLEEIEQEALRLSLLVMKLELEEQALALEQQLQQALAQAETGVTTAMPVPGFDVTEMVVEEPAGSFTEEDIQAIPQQFSEVDLGGEEDVSAFALEETQDEEEAEETGFSGALGPLKNLGVPEFAALGILIFLLAFSLMRRLRRVRAARSSRTPSAVPSSQPAFQPQQGMLREGREDLKEKIVWE